MWETAIILGVLGSVFLWVFLSFNLSEEHNAIKLLLLLMSFLGIGIVLFLSQKIAALNDAGIASVIDSVYTGYLYIFLFSVFYFIIMLLIIPAVRLIAAPKGKMRKNVL